MESTSSGASLTIRMEATATSVVPTSSATESAAAACSSERRSFSEGDPYENSFGQGLRSAPALPAPDSESNEEGLPYGASPLGGRNRLIDHAPEMVYAATATLLVLCPEAAAMALSVWLEETVIAPVYCLEDVVGAEPSVV